MYYMQLLTYYTPCDRVNHQWYYINTLLKTLLAVALVSPLCVCLCLFCLYLTSCWKLIAGTWISWFLIGQIVKKWLCFCDMLDLLTQVAIQILAKIIQSIADWFQLYCTSSVTLTVSGYLAALLLKLSLLWRACYYMKVWPNLPTCSLYYFICLHTLNHNLIGVYSDCLLLCSYRNVYFCSCNYFLTISSLFPH